MALVNERNYSFAYPIAKSVKIAVAASTKIYAGSFVGLASGYARAFVDADAVFAGIALETVDNSAGSAGDVYIAIALEGTIKGVAVVGTADVTDLGNVVYVISEDALTETSTDNTAFGKVVNVLSASNVDVAFKSSMLP